MTVYKAIKKEADAASALAIALAKGDTAGADKLATGSVKDTETSKDVKSVLLEPQAIFPENVKDVIADGFTTAGPSARPPRSRRPAKRTASAG